MQSIQVSKQSVQVNRTENNNSTPGASTSESLMPIWGYIKATTKLNCLNNNNQER